MYFNSNLTYFDRARKAEAAGLYDLAEAYDLAHEAQLVVDAQDDLIQSERAEAFEEGKLKALGKKGTEMLETLREELRVCNTRLSEEYQLNISYRQSRENFIKWFYNPLIKTVAGRKQIVKKIQNNSQSL